MRTFNELLDDLEYRARWEKDEVESAKTTLRCMYHTRVEFIKALLDFINRSPVRSGVCCCGEDMLKHASGLAMGHEPVDMWDYSVAGFIEEYNAKFKED